MWGIKGYTLKKRDVLGLSSLVMMDSFLLLFIYLFLSDCFFFFIIVASFWKQFFFHMVLLGLTCLLRSFL